MSVRTQQTHPHHRLAGTNNWRAGESIARFHAQGRTTRVAGIVADDGADRRTVQGRTQARRQYRVGNRIYRAEERVCTGLPPKTGRSVGPEGKKDDACHAKSTGISCLFFFFLRVGCHDQWLLLWVDEMLGCESCRLRKREPPGEESAAAVAESSRVVICRLCREKAQREKDNRTRRLPSTPFSDPSRGERRGG